MQITLNHSQLTALVKAGLINENKFCQCQTESKEGDYYDSNGKLIIRTTIYVPANEDNELISGSDIINSIKGEAAESYKSQENNEPHEHDEDDLAAAMGE